MSRSTTDASGLDGAACARLRLQLSFGLIAVLVLWGGFVLLPFLVPGYDSVRQTVSEIGQVGSPARAPFTAMLCGVAVCVLLSAWGLRRAALALGRPSIAAWLSGFMAISSVGVGIFAFPHPLHGVFGLSEFVGYQAPWVLALGWRHETRIRGLVPFSWTMGVLLWLAIIANLSVLDLHSWLWQFERPMYGIVQRSLFFFWCLWLAGVSLMLMKHFGVSNDAARATLPATE